jgi:DNA-directed RNA polymerase II subunit RPB1
MELARPVYHGGLIEHIRKVLRCVCYNCSRLLLHKDREEEIRKVKRANRFPKVLKLCDPIKVCSIEEGGCNYIQPKYSKSGLSIKAEHKDPQFD